MRQVMSPVGLASEADWLAHEYGHRYRHDPACAFCQLPTICTGWLIGAIVERREYV